MVFFGNSKIIHFGLLEILPRSILKFSNRAKIQFFHSNCWGTSEFEKQIQLLSTETVGVLTFHQKTMSVCFFKTAILKQL